MLHKNSELLIPYRKLHQENVEREIPRMLLVEGNIFVKEGDEVTPVDIIGECYISTGFRIFNIAETLEIKPGEVNNYLKKEIGAKVFKGELLGEKKKYLGVVTKQFISPCDGILENLNVKNGLLTIRFLPTKSKLLSGFYGKISEVILNKGVKIKTQVNIVKGQIGIGVKREGIFKGTGNLKENLTSVDIDIDCIKKVIWGGSLVTRDIIQKGITLGVKGIVTGGINTRDYRSLIGYLNPQEDVGISLLVLNGFGLSEIDLEIKDMLQKYQNRLVIINPQERDLIIPLGPEEWKKRKSNPERKMNYLKIKDLVTIISWPYFGKKGTILQIHKEKQKIGSLLKSWSATVKTTEGKEIILPIRNLEISN